MGSWDFAGEVMYYVDGAGQHILVWNSLKSAFELLDCRSANYSDRPSINYGSGDPRRRSTVFAEGPRRSVSMLAVRQGDHMMILLISESLNSWRHFRRVAHEALTK